MDRVFDWQIDAFHITTLWLIALRFSITKLIKIYKLQHIAVKKDSPNFIPFFVRKFEIKIHN